VGPGAAGLSLGRGMWERRKLPFSMLPGDFGRLLLSGGHKLPGSLLGA
jgi:hypothetical protein